MADETLNTASSAMSSSWELWEKLMEQNNQSGTSARDYAIAQAVETFINGMPEDPAYQGDAVVENNLTPIIASRQSALECKIKAAPGTDIHIGDIVECLNEKWLITELYIDKVGIISGTMWICNDIIRFQNHSNIVYTRPCVIDDGTYSKKTTDPVAYIPPNTYKLYLPLDSETKYLYVDKRLSFGKIYDSNGSEILEVYKVMGIDLKTKNLGDGSHLSVLTMQRDVYNLSTDSIEWNLCDIYVEPGETSSPQPTGSCVITGRDSVRIGTNRKYVATFYDANGDEASNIIPIWNVTAPEGITVTNESGIITLSVPLTEGLIGEEVTLSVTDASGDYGTFVKKAQVITVG